MNLLPNTEKENLKKGLKLRLLLSLLLLLSIVSLLGVITLLPPYLLLSSNLSELKSVEAQSMKKDNKEIEDVLNLPNQINAKFSIFQASLARASFINVIKKIIDKTTNGIFIDSISFSQNKNFRNKKGTLVLISGLAQSRDSLISFSSALKKEGSFSSVVVPVSSLTKDKNLPFSINIFIEN